ncbi:MAG: Holliday junction resolvase RuvX [Candidatus Sungbacteria bacterium]|nr:Holliday junction resolvase RuvX [Candidatus Sungbacteria bacterium]
MRYLGIDFGRTRIGIAISDPEGRIAFPHAIYLRKNPRLEGDFKKILADEGIEKIIIGLPLADNGGETEESGMVREFSAWLGGISGLPIEFENEMYTSRMAEHAGVKRASKDAASAAIILQSYMDRNNK